MMGETDIIDKFQKGDNATFKYLFDLYFHPLSFIAGNLLRKYNEPTDDFVLFAFTQLFMNRMKIDTEAHIKAFLIFTVTNKCKNFIRDKKRTRSVHARYAQLSENCYDPMSPGFNKQQAFIAIEKSMEDLPPQARKVAELFYFQGMSIGRIAKTLKLKPTSVRQTNSRAVKKLRQEVKSADIN
ncbi:MAG: sigma-70 family RNA polymerase sigma factor [Chitinophagaceae bacterium]